MRRWQLQIDEALADAVLAQARRCAPCETGGVLLGYREEDRRVVRVTELVDGGPAAVRESDRFEPDGAWQQARIADLYERSGRTLQYLGDWHSHPIAGPPSGLDRATARRIARAPNARCEHPVMLVAMCEDDRWKLRAYRWRRLRLHQIPVLPKASFSSGSTGSHGYDYGRS